MGSTNNFENLENVANNFSGIMIPLVCLTLLLFGIGTILYGCSLYKNNVRNKGILYIGLGIGIADAGLIFFILMVVSDNINEFAELNKATNILSLVALLLFIVACWLIHHSKKELDTK